MRCLNKVCLLLVVAGVLNSGYSSDKAIYHYVSIPIIDGTGIYSSVAMHLQSGSVNTRAAAVTNVSLLAAQGALGAFTIFGAEDNYPFLRQVHRYLGFAITASAIWLSVSGWNDPQVTSSLDRIVATGYAGFTVVPIVMFSF